MSVAGRGMRRRRTCIWRICSYNGDDHGLALRASAGSEPRQPAARLYFSNPLAQNIYQIQEGDTLAGISQKTGLSEDYIRELNRVRVRDWDNINAGQRIFIVDPQGRRHGRIP